MELIIWKIKYIRTEINLYHVPFSGIGRWNRLFTYDDNKVDQWLYFIISNKWYTNLNLQLCKKILLILCVRIQILHHKLCTKKLKHSMFIFYQNSFYIMIILVINYYVFVDVIIYALYHLYPVCLFTIFDEKFPKLTYIVNQGLLFILKKLLL